jgi:hypothetical protein
LTRRSERRTPGPEEKRFRAMVVAMILDMRTEEAIATLARHYKVDVPRLGVGVFEGKTKGVLAVYSPARKEILAANRESMYDPFVMIHEFYHHLRSVSGKHKGTEKQADRFAVEHIEAFNEIVSWLRKTSGPSGQGPTADQTSPSSSSSV